MLEHLIEAVLSSTHNLCFSKEIRNSVYPYKPQFYYIKGVCKRMFTARTCLYDA